MIFELIHTHYKGQPLAHCASVMTLLALWTDIELFLQWKYSSGYYITTKDKDEFGQWTLSADNPSSSSIYLIYV